MNTIVKVVQNIHEARNAVHHFMKEKYAPSNIYVLAAEKKRTREAAKRTGAEQIGLMEEGVLTALANMLRTDSAQLAAKMRSFGIDTESAAHLTDELKKGKLAIIAWGGNLNYNAYNEDPGIIYIPGTPYVHNRGTQRRF